MRRKPTPQPLALALALGEGNSKPSTTQTANPSTDAIPIVNANTTANTNATGHFGAGAGATAMGAVTGTMTTNKAGARGEPASTETATQNTYVSPAISRSPVSLQSLQSLQSPQSHPSLQSQPSQQSLRSQHSQSHSQHSTPLTSRFASKRPQTSQTGRGALHTSNTSTNNLSPPHRPPQLQLQNEQSRDNSTAKHPPTASSPYYDKTPGSAPPAFRHVSTEGGKRPSTKSGFFHFNKSSSKGSNQLHNPTSSYPESREQLATRGPDGQGVPKSASMPSLNGGA